MDDNWLRTDFSVIANRRPISLADNPLHAREATRLSVLLNLRQLAVEKLSDRIGGLTKLGCACATDDALQFNQFFPA